jgi:amino acid permease
MSREDLLIQAKDGTESNHSPIDDEDTDEEERGCFSRWFGPVKGGSLRGSTIAMASITFGAGCLAFPAAVKNTGPIVALLIFILCAAFSYYTLYLLLENGSKAKIMDYNLLLEHATSKRVVLISDINNIILCVGVIVSYQFTVYPFMQNLLFLYFGVEENTTNKIIVMTVYFLCIQIPLSLLKNISTLQYASIVGTIALVYSIIVIVVEMFFYIDQNIQDEKAINIWKPISFEYLETFSTFMFGFSSHNGIFQVFTELKRPSVKRYYKVLGRSFTIEVILYLAIAFCGYFSTLENTPPVFLDRDDLKGFNDYFIRFAKLTLFICLHCSMAINYNIMRMSVKTTFFNSENIPFIKDLIITIFTYIATNLLVLQITKISQILGIIGGVCTMVICFVNPILIHISLNKKKLFDKSNIISLIILLIVSVFGTASTIWSIYSIIFKK